MKRRTIFKALVALMVIMLGANFNAEAQFGIINAIDKAAKKNKAKKEQAAQEQKIADQNAKWELAIPQPGESGTILFSVRNGSINEGICMYDPSKLELTMSTTRGGNTGGAVYKIDPATGKVTDKNGVSKGSMSADGTIESPNLGTIKLSALTTTDVTGNSATGFKKIDKTTGYSVSGKGTKLGTVTLKSVSGMVTGDVTAEVNPLLVAYVFYGLSMTEKELTVKQLGYDPDKKYTTDELEDMCEWADETSIVSIAKYEASLPYAGFKNTNPELKNCTVGCVGLMDTEWREQSEKDSKGYTNWFYTIKYWVLYELEDGRNIITFSIARKEGKYADVTRKWQVKDGEFHEVTDWERED